MRALVFIIAAAFMAAVSHAETINVPGDYPIIQEAIAVAVDGDTIEVEAGTYWGAIDFQAKAITIVSVDGPEGTIINGKGESPVVRIVQAGFDGATISGFTITGGWGDVGGGVYVSGVCGAMSQATITDCIIENNDAELGAGMYITGGCACYASAINLSNCIIRNNTSGSGIHAVDTSDTWCSLVLRVEDCSIIGNGVSNSINHHGGGMRVDVDSLDPDVVITGCTISDNMALTGGGLHLAGLSALSEVSDCTISDNTGMTAAGGVHLSSVHAAISGLVISNNLTSLVAADGGGLYVRPDPASPTVITQCEITGNSTADNGGGVFVYNMPGETQFVDCKITQNVAHGSSYDNGHGGGLYIVHDSSGSNDTILTNCLLTGNSGWRGGAIALGQHGTVELHTTTVADNQALDKGAGIFDAANAGNPHAQCSNSILWGNTDLTGESASAQIDVPASLSWLHDCIVQSWPDDPADAPIPTLNVLSANPRFADPENNDYRLFALSPAIDAANNGDISVTTDLDGQPRFVDDPISDDTGAGTAPFADFGPYEYQPPDSGTPGDRIWIGGSSGYFEYDANWYPSAAPQVLDTALFARADESVDVSFSSLAATTGLVVGAGDIRLDLSSQSYDIQQTLVVGPFEGDTAQLSLDLGSGGGDLTLPSLDVGSWGRVSLSDNHSPQITEVWLDPWGIVVGGAGLTGGLTSQGGRLLPGMANGDPAEFTIFGEYSQWAAGSSESPGWSGALELDIAGPQAGVDHDRLLVTGLAELSGMLRLDFDADYAPNIGDSFDLFQFGKRDGNFDVLFCSGLAPGRSCTFASPLRGGDVDVDEQIEIAFLDPASVDIGGVGSDIAIVDLNGDGFNDVAVPIEANGTVVILLNNGMSGGIWQGLALQTPSVVVGGSPGSISAADFDNDGNADLVVSNFDDDDISVLMNNGTASFTRTDIQVEDGPVDVTTGNFVTSDAMSRIDIVVACAGNLNRVVILQNVTSMAGRGSDFLQTASAAVMRPTQIDPSDVDTNKDLDVVITSADNDMVGIRTLEDDGTIPLGMMTAIGVGDAPTRQVVVNLGDDTKDEIVTVNQVAGSISVIPNDAFGYGPAATTAIGSSPEDIAAGDFDGDGDNDLAVIATPAGGVPSIIILRNDTDTVITLSELPDLALAGLNPSRVASGDLDGDGLADLVAISDGVVLRGSGAGASVTTAIATAPSSSCLGDIDLSGTVDIADLLAIISAWGACPGCPEDIDDSGTVDVADLLTVIAAWGPCE